MARYPASLMWLAGITALKNAKAVDELVKECEDSKRAILDSLGPVVDDKGFFDGQIAGEHD